MILSYLYHYNKMAWETQLIKHKDFLDRIDNNQKYPSLSGKNLMYLLKRQSSSFIDENKLYNFFDLIDLGIVMIEKYQLKIVNNLENIMQQLCYLYDENIKDCLLYNVLYMFSKERADKLLLFNSEEHLYSLIRQDISNLIPGATIIDFKIKDRKVPDFMIELDNQKIPVEVKAREIGLPALRQLVMYMDIYNSNKGYLIGRNLKIDLPDNIEFINISHLNDKFYPQE